MRRQKKENFYFRATTICTNGGQKGWESGSYSQESLNWYPAAMFALYKKDVKLCKVGYTKKAMQESY